MERGIILLLFLCQWITQISSSSAPSVKLHSNLQRPRPFRDLVITESKTMQQNSFQYLHVGKKESLAIGKVLGVGPGEKLLNGQFVSTQTKFDELVVYPTATAEKFSINGISHDLIHEGNILLKCASFEPKLEEVSCFADHILVEFLLPDHQAPTGSKVITPNSLQTRLSLAKVIKVGHPYRFLGEEKVDLSPGDRILLSKNEGPRHPISLEGKIYYLVHVQDVFAAL
jgi:co-chaperonin GroES (HSP10)